MAEDNVAFVRRCYEGLNGAYRTGQFLPVIQEGFDPDVVVKPSGLLPDSNEARGHDGVLRFIVAQWEAFEELQIEAEAYIAAGDRVIVPVRLRGRARHTGLEVEFRFVHMMTIRDRKITRVDMYLDKQEALEAAGLG
ncbi:MAG TPA: nuclear transport factor 2 family protein [Gaiellaceae bacterium]|jgi:ketosteroid isomerase-like protein